MITKHLADEEIQQYALDKTRSEPWMIAHVAGCKDCEAKINAYHLLMEGIRQQPTPVFDFNLSELVMAQLPSPQPNYLPDNFFIYIVFAVVIALMGAAGYMFRAYLADVFAGISSFVFYLLVTTCVTISIVLFIDMYKTYQRKLHALGLK